MNNVAGKMGESGEPRKWVVKGTRGGKQVSRIVEGKNYPEVVQTASTGRGFMLVTSCILITDAVADRAKVMKLYPSLQKK